MVQKNFRPKNRRTTEPPSSPDKLAKANKVLGNDKPAEEIKVPKNKKPKKDEPKIVTIMSRYNFTETEKKVMSQELAQKLERKGDLELEKKASMSTYKEKVDVVVHEINTLAAHVRNGHEQREFKCKMIKDYKKNVKVYTDVYTKKLVEERPFESQDYQRTFV